MFLIRNPINFHGGIPPIRHSCQTRLFTSCKNSENVLEFIHAQPPGILQICCVLHVIQTSSDLRTFPVSVVVHFFQHLFSCEHGTHQGSDTKAHCTLDTFVACFSLSWLRSIVSSVERQDGNPAEENQSVHSGMTEKPSARMQHEVAQTSKSHN